MNEDDTAQSLPRKTRNIVIQWLDSTVWDQIQLDPTDIIIATYPKSGTTWTQQIVAQLLNQGSDKQLDLWATSPWMEARLPDQVKVEWVEKLPPRRFFKSHLPADALPYSKHVRYINVMRDGRDVMWSRHAQRLLIDAKKGTPPPADVNQSARRFFLKWLDSDHSGEYSYFGHIKSWWQYRHVSNIKIIHYANLKADLAGEMRKLAPFLDINIDEACWSETVERCTFAHMKRNSNQILAAYDRRFPGGAKAFMHKGEVGGWRDVLTSEDVERYERRVVRELGEACATWLANGGQYN